MTFALQIISSNIDSSLFVCVCSTQSKGILVNVLSIDMFCVYVLIFLSIFIFKSSIENLENSLILNLQVVETYLSPGWNYRIYIGILLIPVTLTCLVRYNIFKKYCLIGTPVVFWFSLYLNYMLCMGVSCKCFLT